MNEYVLNLTLDINCRKSVTRLFMGQYDIGRKAEITVTADGEPYTCKNCTVVCQGVRGDRTHFAFDCEVDSAGHIIATFDEILKSSGIAFAKFVISDSKHSYSTQNFIIDCDHALLGNITNNDDYITLSKLIERVHALTASGAVLVDTELSSTSINPVANSVIYSALSGKQKAQYIIDTITTVENLIALNDVNTVYNGVMSGFSSIFGQNTDSTYIGFRMWFVQHSPKQAISFDRIILLQDGSIWSAGSKSSTVFKQITYSKKQVDAALADKANFAEVNAALAGKANKSTTLSGYGIKDAYTKTEVDTALKEKQNVQYLNDTVTDINDFIAYNQTNTVYTGRMQGFSKKFGELSDTVAKGFRMWFVLSGADNPTWYRIVLFDDGAVWTAQRSGTTFTQRSYTKSQVDKLLGEKADTADVNTALNLKANFSDVQAALAGKANKSTTLAGYGITNSYSKTEVDNLLDGIDTTKTEILSGSISSAEQLNNYTDMEKTYLFYVVPPLALSLPVSVGMLCILNNYDNFIQTLRTARYENKIFIREYDSSKGTWSGFTDITVPDNYITKTKLSADLSAEISGKYDSSNVESGQGELTYDESIKITDKIFRYQRVGKIATVTMKITAGENIAANALTLSGLPYINKATGIYLKILSTKNNDIVVQIPYNTGQMKVVSALVPGEALVFTFSYQISY